MLIIFLNNVVKCVIPYILQQFANRSHLMFWIVCETGYFLFLLTL